MRFIFDLDALLRPQEHYLTDNLILMLQGLAEQNHEVIFTSSNSIRDILPMLPKEFHGFPIVGANGSLICENGATSQVAGFSVHEIPYIETTLEKYDATFLIEGEWDYAYTGGRFHPIMKQIDPFKLAQNKSLKELDFVVKILVLEATNMIALRDDLKQMDMSVYYDKENRTIEITPVKVNKWTALQKLGVERNNYIAFGSELSNATVFDNAQYAVGIGATSNLCLFANEFIAQLDEEIVKKCSELTEKYSMH